jgi:hypothetical protein
MSPAKPAALSAATSSALVNSPSTVKDSALETMSYFVTPETVLHGVLGSIGALLAAEMHAGNGGLGSLDSGFEQRWRAFWRTHLAFDLAVVTGGDDRFGGFLGVTLSSSW